MALPGPCPACHRLLDNHCARGCGWMVCLNATCSVYRIDAKGRTIEKTPRADAD